MALHMIRTTCHQQIGRFCLALQGNHHAIRIIIPKGGVNDVVSRFWRLERNTCHVKLSVVNKRSEYGIIYLGRQLWMAPFPNALCRNLKSSGLWTR